MRRLLAAAVVVVLVAVGVLLGSAVSQYGLPGSPDSTSGPAGGPPAGTRVRVEVLNGGGVAGAAGEATTVLRDLGFDVVYFGNAADFGRDTSAVLDRVGRLEAARSVADALGIRSVRSEPDSNLYLDVSVVLGTDWTAPGHPADGEPDTGPWWDPRTWLKGSTR